MYSNRPPSFTDTVTHFSACEKIYDTNETNYVTERIQSFVTREIYQSFNQSIDGCS